MSSGIEVALARALTTTAIFLFLETPVPPGKTQSNRSLQLTAPEVTTAPASARGLITELCQDSRG